MSYHSTLPEEVDEGDSMIFRRAACLYADVSGYCRLIERDVRATVRVLATYRNAMGRIVSRHGGRVVDMAGDSLLAEFPSAEAAVRSGLEIQRDVEARNAALPAGQRLWFRIGIDLGEVLADEGRIYGSCVNIAARMQEMADPGRICIAGGAWDHIDSTALPARVEYLGERFVKNVDLPQRVYDIGWESTPW